MRLLERTWLVYRRRGAIDEAASRAKIFRLHTDGELTDRERDQALGELFALTDPVNQRRAA